MTTTRKKPDTAGVKKKVGQLVSRRRCQFWLGYCGHAYASFVMPEEQPGTSGTVPRRPGRVNCQFFKAGKKMAGPLSRSRLKVRLAPPSMDTGDCAAPPSNIRSQPGTATGSPLTGSRRLSRSSVKIAFIRPPRQPPIRSEPARTCALVISKRKTFRKPQAFAEKCFFSFFIHLSLKGRCITLFTKSNRFGIQPCIRAYITLYTCVHKG